MPGGSDILLFISTIAVAYRFQLKKKTPEIERLLGVTSSTLYSLFDRVQERSETLNLADVLRNIDNIRVRGKTPLVQPGSAESYAVRNSIRLNKRHDPVVAVNQLTDRQPLGELDINVLTLKTRQVRHIRLDSEHYEGDPKDQRRLKRKREIQKPGGYDPKKRRQYCKPEGELHGYLLEQATIIVCDEEKWPFGGTSNTHATVPEGEDSFVTSNPTRFIREQCSAACAQNVTILRPHIISDQKDK